MSDDIGLVAGSLHEFYFVDNLPHSREMKITCSLFQPLLQTCFVHICNTALTREGNETLVKRLCSL